MCCRTSSVRAVLCQSAAYLLIACATTWAQSGGDPEAQGANEQPNLACLTSASDIREALPTLSPSEREYLRRQREKFDALSWQQRQDLRQMHRSVMATDHPQRLHQLLRRYQDWLAGLPANDREEILALAPAARIEAIKEKLSELNLPRSGELPVLNHEDTRAFLKWLGRYIDQNDQRLIDLLPGDVQKQVRGMRHSPRRSMVMVGELLERKLDIFGESQADMEELDNLERALTPSAGAQLQKARETASVNELISGWLQSIRMRMNPININRERIRQFFENELSAEERGQLESLPPDEMERQLRRLFFERRVMRRRSGPSPGPANR